MSAKTIHCTAILSDVELRDKTVSVIKEIPTLQCYRALPSYPDSLTLEHFLRSNPGRIIFLDARNIPEATRIASALEAHDPMLQIIAFGTWAPNSLPRELLNAGIREYVDLPLTTSTVFEAVERRVRFLARIPDYLEKNVGSFYSMLPAKPGAGASTVAASVSTILSLKHSKKTLLTDCDTSSGALAFRYRLEPVHSVFEALAKADVLDDQLWSSLCIQRNRLDILPSDTRPSAHIETASIIRVLDFIRSKYDIAVFDLSGNLEPHTHHIMQDCKTIYLVCTQELDCLHVARTKAKILRDLRLDDRVRVLINRFRKDNSLNQAHIEDLLELKVDAVLPNDYRAAEASIVSGTPVSSRSSLGRSLETFAAQLLNTPIRRRSHRFIEFLTLPGFRYGANLAPLELRD